MSPMGVGLTEQALPASSCLITPVTQSYKTLVSQGQEAQAKGPIQDAGGRWEWPRRLTVPPALHGFYKQEHGSKAGAVRLPGLQHVSRYPR